MLLIVGGSQDHNINRLADAAKWRGEDYRVIYTDSDPPPAVRWHAKTAELEINGECFSPEGTSLFIRYDVFGDQDDTLKAGLFDTFKGWAGIHRQIGMLNRGNENLEMNKPRALILARSCGFDIPKTWIANDFNEFAGKESYIVKPVNGGDYTKSLDDMPEKSDRPFIVQPKLQYPELRIFRVGKHYFAFEITSPALDYRTTDDFSMREVLVPDHLLKPMRDLTNMLGLDYAAADLKTDPETGRLLFLEINTMPMFTGYDNVAKGRLSDAIYLTLQEFARKPAANSNNTPKVAP